MLWTGDQGLPQCGKRSIDLKKKKSSAVFSVRYYYENTDLEVGRKWENQFPRNSCDCLQSSCVLIPWFNDMVNVKSTINITASWEVMESP